MSTSIIQKVTNSKPFKAYGMFCLIRGAVVAIASACYIASGVAYETRQSEHHPSSIPRTPSQSAPHRAEPRKVIPHPASAYQCPYQSHFRDDKSATKLY